MLYVLSELVVYLLIAIGIGFLIGWLERGRRGLGAIDRQLKREALNSRNEQSSLNNKIATLQDQLDTANREADSLRAENRHGGKLRADLLKAQTEVEGVKAELDAAESRASTLQSDLDKAKQAKDKQISGLKQAEQDRDAAQQELEQLKERLNSTEATLEATRKDLSAATEVAGHVSGDSGDIDSLEADLEAAQIELSAAQASMESVLSDSRNVDEAVDIEFEDEPETKAPNDKPVDDNLKVIKGIGPVLEKKLKALGYTSYQQLAHLSDADSKRINEELNFKDRHLRDDWKGRAQKAHDEKYG